MSILILPQRFTGQPQYNTPLDPYWLGRGLVVACNPAVGAINQASKSSIYAVINSGGMLTTVTQTGRPWKGETSKYVDFGSGYAATTGVTAIQIVNPGTASGFTFTSRVGVNSDGIELLIGAASIPGDAQARMGSPLLNTPSISGLHDNKDHVVAIRWRPSTELAIWADNLNNKKNITASVPATLTPTQNLRLHRRATDGAYAGYSGLFLYFNSPLADAEIAALLENPNVVYRARRRQLWVVTATTHDLTILGESQVNAANTPAISQTHILNGASSTTTNTSTTPAIVQAHALAAVDGTQSNAASEGEITHIHSLGVANSIQGNVASEPSLTQGLSLAIANVEQGNNLNVVGVTQAHVLTKENILQENQSVESSLAQTHKLVVSHGTQSNNASETAVSLGIAHNLAAGGFTQSSATVSGSITQAHSFANISDSQGNGVQSATVTQTHALIAVSIAQNKTLSSVGITQTHIFVVANIAQDNVVPSTAIVAIGALVVSSLSLANQLGSGLITQLQILISQSRSQSNGSSVGAITLPSRMSSNTKYVAYSYIKNYTAVYKE